MELTFVTNKQDKNNGYSTLFDERTYPLDYISDIQHVGLFVITTICRFFVVLCRWLKM